MAQIVKDTSFIRTRLARTIAAEQKKEEIAAKVKEENALRESRKTEKEKKRKEFMEKKNSDNGSESDNLEAEEGGFSIPRSRAPSPSDLSLSEPGTKRPSASPAAAAPDSKNVKMTHRDSDSRRGPGHH